MAHTYSNLSRHKVCSVNGCRYESNEHIKKYSFPKSSHYRKIWVEFCGREEDFNIKHAIICERHFSPKNIKRNLKYELLGRPLPKRYRDLKDDAVPDMNFPFKDQSDQNDSIRLIKRLQDDNQFNDPSSSSSNFPSTSSVKKEPVTEELGSQTNDLNKSHVLHKNPFIKHFPNYIKEEPGDYTIYDPEAIFFKEESEDSKNNDNNGNNVLIDIKEEVLNNSEENNTDDSKLTTDSRCFESQDASNNIKNEDINNKICTKEENYTEDICINKNLNLLPISIIKKNMNLSKNEQNISKFVIKIPAVKKSSCYYRDKESDFIFKRGAPMYKGTLYLDCLNKGCTAKLILNTLASTRRTKGGHNHDQKSQKETYEKLFNRRRILKTKRVGVDGVQKKIIFDLEGKKINVDFFKKYVDEIPGTIKGTTYYRDIDTQFIFKRSASQYKTSLYLFCTTKGCPAQFTIHETKGKHNVKGEHNHSQALQNKLYQDLILRRGILEEISTDGGSGSDTASNNSSELNSNHENYIYAPANVNSDTVPDDEDNEDHLSPDESYSEDKEFFYLSDFNNTSNKSV